MLKQRTYTTAMLRRYVNTVLICLYLNVKAKHNVPSDVTVVCLQAKDKVPAVSQTQSTHDAKARPSLTLKIDAVGYKPRSACNLNLRTSHCRTVDTPHRLHERTSRLPQKELRTCSLTLIPSANLSRTFCTVGHRIYPHRHCTQSTTVTTRQTIFFVRRRSRFDLLPLAPQ